MKTVKKYLKSLVEKLLAWGGGKGKRLLEEPDAYYSNPYYDAEDYGDGNIRPTVFIASLIEEAKKCLPEYVKITKYNDKYFGYERDAWKINIQCGNLIIPYNLNQYETISDNLCRLAELLWDYKCISEDDFNSVCDYLRTR